MMTYRWCNVYALSQNRSEDIANTTWKCST